MFKLPSQTDQPHKANPTACQDMPSKLTRKNQRSQSHRLPKSMDKEGSFTRAKRKPTRKQEHTILRVFFQCLLIPGSQRKWLQPHSSSNQITCSEGATGNTFCERMKSEVAKPLPSFPWTIDVHTTMIFWVAWDANHSWTPRELGLEALA